MPFTFFAHQTPVLPLKLARPRWFDGTALCIGSMAPDLGYPLGGWAARQSHTALGIVTWSLGATIVICWVIRWRIASIAFAHMPDTGVRAHSYRVLACRRPPLWSTASSALIGASTHVFIDGFTHTPRWGARWLSLDDHFLSVPIRGTVPLARVLQYTGHTLGTLAGVALLGLIARRGLLERWYGADTVARVRQFSLPRAAHVVFWFVVALGVPAGLLWAEMTTGVRAFRVIDAVAISTFVACCLPICQPRALAAQSTGAAPASP